jgi:hypothetical protein
LAAERLADRAGEFDQPARRPAHRRRLAEQFDQQRVVHVGPPWQPDPAHLHGQQCPGGLGRDQ